MRIAVLALVHSTAEHCAPAWCPSAHIRIIDPAIKAMRIATGCLRPTPVDKLPVLAGIQPAELRRKGAALSLARRGVEPGHLLHLALTCPVPTECECTASQIETSICTRRITTHQFL